MGGRGRQGGRCLEKCQAGEEQIGEVSKRIARLERLTGSIGTASCSKVPRNDKGRGSLSSRLTEVRLLRGGLKRRGRGYVRSCVTIRGRVGAMRGRSRGSMLFCQCMGNLE